MRKNIPLIFCLLLFTLSIKAQKAPKDTIARRIVLIGDGGELTNARHPVAEAVRKTIIMDERTTVVYLGDNIYDSGLPDDQSSYYQAAKAVLDSQLSVADNTPAQVYMIPGNHDWKNNARDGYAAVLREQAYVDQLGKPNVQFFPKDGCPGPVEVNLSGDVTLILFDSQWWIQTTDKPGIESDCPCKTKEEVIAQMEDIVSRNAKKLVIFACHHPFKSNGIHGGYFPLKKHIFPFTDINPNLYIPLPILGSIYPIARSVFGTPQDLKHPNYANMINMVSATAKSHPNVLFVAGHEHNLEYIKDSSYNYIISGGGCKMTRVESGKRSPFLTESIGFAVLEISTNKNVSLTFYTVTDSIRNVYHTNLMNFSKIPEEKKDSSTRVVEAGVKYKDTTTISASDKYPTVSGLKKFFMGQNYRKEWSTPVNMKVFKIGEEKGGFTIVSLGGGKQTRSLRLRDKDGKNWVLRTSDKNPSQAIPANFRGTVAQGVVQDMISASHPYASLAIPPLASAIDVVAPHPELFFVPDDPAFGFYRPLFANTVCFLEERDPSSDGSDTKSTAKVFNTLLEENDHRADQLAVLRARLLDVLVGDFDRHFDQWKWATNDTGKGKLYYPIPRDRDQAFFYSDGELLKLTSKNLLPFLKGFKKDIPSVDWLGYSARDFDRLFLTDLDKIEWRKTIGEMQSKLSDSVIRAAIQMLPPEIYAISGDKIVEKLISRRNLLGKAGIRYYNFISKQVNVIGSNQKEYFKVSNNGKGLEVKVYAREAGNDTSFVMYDRTFYHKTTNEIRLYGLNDDDLFEIQDNASSRIKVRIIGGKGNDTFNISGNVRNLLYDMKVEGNYISHTSHTKNRFSQDPSGNSLNVLGFNYNKSRFPQLEFSVNSDDGLLVGAGFSRTTQGFRNDPFATDQRFSALYSATRGAYKFNYNGEFNHVTRNTDIVLHGDFGYPALTNFFGLGNRTEKDPNVNYGFYRTRIRTLELQAFLRKRMFDKLHLMVGPYFYQYWNHYDENADRILGKPSLIGIDSSSIYATKTYLGAKLVIRFDNRNNLLFPTRGVLWNNELVSVAGLGSNSHNFTKASSDMLVYASLSDPPRAVAVLRFGGGHIFNRNFEYFQGMDIGSKLHGFRKNRYLGQSSAYVSTELRFQLVDVKSYLLPGPLGLIGFYDAGRVWLKGERSHTWHGAYGGGFYFIPFNQIFVSGTVGFAAKEKIFNFTLGTKINFTF